MTNAATSPKLEATITLTVPVMVKAADGKDAERTKIVMRRPKTKHAKRLAVILGPEILKWALSSDSAESGEADERVLMAQVLNSLLSEGRLEALTGVIASMCDEAPETIDEIDPVDLLEVGKAFVGFFPGLQSLLGSLSQPT